MKQKYSKTLSPYIKVGTALTGAVALGTTAILSISYLCYRMAFAVPKKYKSDPHFFFKNGKKTEIEGEMRTMIDNAVSLPYEEVSIESFDGTTLYGRYYETKKGAPLQILFHGYRSAALRDFSGGLPLALKSGCNALLVDQRAHGKSRGKCLSFGILERYDCLAWANYASKRFGQETKILLTGISMGAATVLMAAELPLPENVAGIIADCGYSSPREIIRKVIGEMHLPVAPSYTLLKLGGKLYGGFDIEAADPTRAMEKASLPVLFIHGEGDDFVPFEMSKANFDACPSENKKFLAVKEAGHGLSYIVDTAAYEAAVRTFLEKTTGIKTA